MYRTQFGVICLAFDVLHPERGDFWQCVLPSGEIVQSKNMRTIYKVVSTLYRSWKRDNAR